MLPETQKILHKFYDFHHRNLRDSLPDLKPKMSPFDENESTAYGVFDEMTLIYQLMYHLYLTIDGDLFRGEYDVCFLHPKEIIEKIKSIHTTIEENTAVVKQINLKYEAIQNETDRLQPMSIFMVYDAHVQALKTLNYILDTDEVAIALEPGIVDRLKKENQKIKFESHWDGYLKSLKWKLIVYIFLVVIPVIIIITSDSSYKFVAILPIIIPFIDSFISKQGIIDLVKIVFSPSFRKKFQEKLYNQLYK